MQANNGLERWMKDGSNVMVYNAPPAVVESISFTLLLSVETDFINV